MEGLRLIEPEFLRTMASLFDNSDQDRVTVATFPNRVVADMAAGFLEGEGIEVWVAADDAGGAYPVLQSLQGVRLLVPAEEADRAREILEALQAEPAESKDFTTDNGEDDEDGGATVLPFPKIKPPESG
jgi:predicted Fe-Mo cluster-binding NifX family protein